MSSSRLSYNGPHPQPADDNVSPLEIAVRKGELIISEYNAYRLPLQFPVLSGPLGGFRPKHTPKSCPHLLR